MALWLPGGAFHRIGLPCVIMGAVVWSDPWGNTHLYSNRLQAVVVNLELAAGI